MKRAMPLACQDAVGAGLGRGKASAAATKSGGLVIVVANLRPETHERCGSPTPARDDSSLITRSETNGRVPSTNGRITPYAWMWQLGSQRIVGKPSLTINTVDLLHNPVRPLYRRGDQGFGPWTGLGIKEVFSRSQMAGHRNSGDNREHTIASLFHEGSESNSFLFAMPVRRDHQTMSNGQRVQFAPGCRTPRK